MRVYFYLLIALISLFLAGSPVAQEEAELQASSEDALPDEVVEEEAVTAEAEEEEEEFDDTGLDDQSYEEDDDDFVPTQEVPVDTPIPFPSNI